MNTNAELGSNDAFMEWFAPRHPGENEYHQAVRGVVGNLLEDVREHSGFCRHRILQRLTEPDRIITFRVVWEDDDGVPRINRGYRVQHSNALGPYKVGLRFDSSVSPSILKFLAFEQLFKNSLTGLDLGAAKGGSDFNPKGRSDREVMRFCHAFMTELYRHIGHMTDVPAGDIGVGSREIAYLFGQSKRLENQFSGALTGNSIGAGGSQMRTEATGYGAVYFMENMLKRVGDSVEGKTVAVSGSGNVATYAVEKVNHLGGKVVTLSDSSGFIHDPEGIDVDKLAFVLELKNVRRGRIKEYADEYGSATFHEGRPWGVPCDLALPCATQNEISEKDAKTLLQNGCIGVSEGANMPTELAGIDAFQEAKILYAPSKAANAGGVAVSGLEMSQNSGRVSWKEDDLDNLLKETMFTIHESCVEYGNQAGHINYLAGANIAGFVKVADAMLSFGHT